MLSGIWLRLLFHGKANVIPAEARAATTRNRILQLHKILVHNDGIDVPVGTKKQPVMYGVNFTLVRTINNPLLMRKILAH